MMIKKQTSPWALLKALYVLPVAFAAVTVISCTSPKEKAPYPIRIGLNDVKHYNINDFGERPTIVIKKNGGSTFARGSVNDMPNPIKAFLKGGADRQELLAGFKLTDEDIDSVQIYYPGEHTFYTHEEDGVIEIFVPKQTELHRYKGEVLPQPSSTNTPTTIAPQEPTTEEEVFNVVEEDPMYPGGMEELMKFLQKEIKYPKEAQDKKIQGRVIVQFVVKKDGSIAEAKVVRSVDPLLDAEALRVVSAMPNWTPGKQKGEPVNVRFTLPVVFRMQ